MTCRFQLNVLKELEKHEPDVVMLDIALSPSMRIIQQNIVALITIMIDEIRDCNKQAELSELTVENVLYKSFERAIYPQFQTALPSMSKKTKQLFDDLINLRRMAVYLTRYDCVSFYMFLEGLRVPEVRFGISEPYWLLTDEAASIFTVCNCNVNNIVRVQSNVYILYNL